MKTAIIGIVALVVVVAGVVAGCWGYSRRDTAATLPLTARPQGKIAIVYYSQSSVQNTALVARWIQGQVGGDLLPLEMASPYPEPYGATLAAAGKHHRENARPPLKALPSLDGYDVVFLGSPIWYGTYAPPVATFLDVEKLTGKVVAPFCTHGGGGAGRFAAAVREACPGAEVLEPLVIRGSNQVERRLGLGVTLRHDADDVVAWLNRVFKP